MRSLPTPVLPSTATRQLSIPFDSGRLRGMSPADRRMALARLIRHPLVETANRRAFAAFLDTSPVLRGTGRAGDVRRASVFRPKAVKRPISAIPLLPPASTRASF
jgi:hypothetical protein